MITVLFFASLKEVIGASSMTIALADVRLSQLIEHLISDHPSWREALTAEKIVISVNQEIVRGDVLIAAGDEVAFLPPVTGG